MNTRTNTANAAEFREAAPATEVKPAWIQRERRAVYLAVIAVAAVLRFVALGRQPLWLDEATDAVFGARSFWNCVFAENVHPPLYRALLHFAIVGFGNSNFSTRLLPAVFGIAAVPMAGLLARHYVPRAELAALVLAGTSPFLIYFSQENRDYSLFILLTLVSTWAFGRFCATGRGLPLYCVACILLLYTHYLSVFVLLAHEIVYWMCVRREVGGWIASRAAAAVAFAPWLAWAARGYERQSRLFVPPALLVPGAMLRFFMGYGIVTSEAMRRIEPISQKIVREAPVVGPAMCLFCWLLWCGFRDGNSTANSGQQAKTDKAKTDKEWKVLVFSVVLLPWAILLLLAPWAQLAQERYLAFQAPFVLLVAAAGLESLQPRARIAAGMLVAVAVGFSLVAYYDSPGRLFGYSFLYGKENWAGAAAFVRQANPDVLIVAPDFLQLPLDRYWHEGHEIPAREGVPAIPDLGGAQRTALVLSHVGPVQEQLNAAMDARYARVGEATFPSQNMIRVIVYDTSRARVEIAQGETAGTAGH